jgi:hypothetical protein
MGVGEQQLPVPGTPPAAVQSAADGRNEQLDSVQSASDAQELPSSQTPATQLLLVVRVQFTVPSRLPHVERAEQRTELFRQRRVTAPSDAATAALVALATHLT